ncbi:MULTISPECIES: hypothetical protein [unclassified Paraflavitalea]
MKLPMKLVYNYGVDTYMINDIQTTLFISTIHQSVQTIGGFI